MNKPESSLYELIPPSAAEWLEGCAGAASAEWRQGWDACRNRCDTLIRAAAPAAHPSNQVLQEPRDNCEFCLGAKGGVLGNENRIGGHVVCDYCTPLLQNTIAAASTQAVPSEQPIAEQPKSDKANLTSASGGDASKTALPEDARDAARYRWLREHSYVEIECDSPRVNGWAPDRLDCTIDAAMNTSTE